MTTARHLAGRRSSLRFTARAALLSVLVVALLIAAVFPIRTYLSERSKINALTQQANALQRQIAKQERTIDKLHDPDYLEKLARECLGMVKPGEVAFVLVPKHGAPKPVRC